MRACVSVSAFLAHAYYRLFPSLLFCFPVLACSVSPSRPFLPLIPTATVADTNTTDNTTAVHRRRHLFATSLPSCTVHPHSAAETQHPGDDNSLVLPGLPPGLPTPLVTTSTNKSRFKTATTMRRQTPIAHLLYAYLFPRPKDDDPPSFAAHLALNLVQEVRVEVGLFYGDLVTIEAKYPGLDYCYGPHRMRLGRFPHHARLFAAFDALNLTYQEIQDFCCWEGTRWARERYEKDEGCIIEDTTGDHIPLFVDPRLRDSEPRRGSIIRKTDISVVFQDAPADLRQRRSRPSQQQAAVYIPTTAARSAEQEDEEDGQEDINMSDSASDTTASPQSEEGNHNIRVHLEHLSALERQNAARLAAHIEQLQAASAQGAPLTPEQEQLLKDQRERNASRQQAMDVGRSVGFGLRALAGEASASARAAA